MTHGTYVLDTHALVHFFKGELNKIGSAGLRAMNDAQACIIVPSYVVEEVSRKFTPQMRPPNDMLVPPTPLLRLLGKCANVRVLARGAATLAIELQLRRHRRMNGIPDQDIPIAAAVLVAREYSTGPVNLISGDGPLTKWAAQSGITVVWRR